MARSHARVFTSIWGDPDFCALSRAARHMYLYLLSQPDLEHSGIIGLRVNRWADNCADETPGSIRDALGELEKARFVAIDWQKEELLVRSLIRRDEVWRQPNVFKAAATSARNTRSALIRTVLLAELERLDRDAATREVVNVCAALIQELRASLPSPSPDPSGNSSRTPSEPFERGSQEAAWKGSSNGGSVREPLSPVHESPSPREPAGLIQHPLLTAVPDLPNEGEGDQSQEQAERDALVAEARAAHPRWGSASIVRALGAVAERPWPLVLAAARKCWADPATKHPGRLEHDGDWWVGGGPAATQGRTLHCERHLLDYAEGGECRSCAADRKAAS